MTIGYEALTQKGYVFSWFCITGGRAWYLKSSPVRMAEACISAPRMGAIGERMEKPSKEWIIERLVDYKACRSHREVTAIESMFEQWLALKLPLVGTWPEDDLRRAFVAGAAWWEYEEEGATIWPSDRAKAEIAAEKHYPGGKPR